MWSRSRHPCSWNWSTGRSAGTLWNIAHVIWCRFGRCEVRPEHRRSVLPKCCEELHNHLVSWCLFHLVPTGDWQELALRLHRGETSFHVQAVCGLFVPTKKLVSPLQFIGYRGWQLKTCLCNKTIETVNISDHKSIDYSLSLMARKTVALLLLCHSRQQVPLSQWLYSVAVVFSYSSWISILVHVL